MPERGNRIVLAVKAHDGFVPYRWTGHEPEGLNDADQACMFGAKWEGDELVTYDYGTLKAQHERWDDQWQTDDD